MSKTVATIKNVAESLKKYREKTEQIWNKRIVNLS